MVLPLSRLSSSFFSDILSIMIHDCMRIDMNHEVIMMKLYILLALISGSNFSSEMDSEKKVVIALDIKALVDDAPDLKQGFNILSGVSMAWNFGSDLIIFNNRQEEMRAEGERLSLFVDGACNVTKKMLDNLGIQNNYKPNQIKLLTDFGIQPKIKEEGCKDLNTLVAPLIAVTSHDPYHQELYMAKLGKHCVKSCFNKWLLIPYALEKEELFRDIAEGYVPYKENKNWLIAKDTYPSLAYLKAIRAAADQESKDSPVLLFSTTTTTKKPDQKDLDQCGIELNPYVSIEDIRSKMLLKK